jgi:hypothetical protein
MPLGGTVASLGILTLPSGRKIEAEVTTNIPAAGAGRPSSDEFAPAGPGGAAGKVVQATLDLNESLSAIAEFADSMIGQFLQLARKPEEVALEVSLKVGAAGNLIIAGGSIEGAIKIGLKYRA